MTSFQLRNNYNNTIYHIVTMKFKNKIVKSTNKHRQIYV